jgi:biopolymer transport protein ExbB/TolQ
MTRLLTTIVQMFIAIPALYMGRIVGREVIADMREMWQELH